MQVVNNKKVTMWSLAGLLFTSMLPTATMADARAQLNQDIQQANQTKNQMSGLKSQQQATLDQIHQLEAQINDTMVKSTQLQQQKAVTQKSLDAQQVKLRGRVKAMYESGDVSYLEVLLDSTSFSDFLDRFDALTLIIGQDKQMIDQYQSDMQKLQQQQADLDAEQADRKGKQQQLLALESQVQTQYAALSNQLGSQNAQIATEQGEVASEQAALQAAEQYNAQHAQVNNLSRSPDGSANSGASNTSDSSSSNGQSNGSSSTGSSTASDPSQSDTSSPVSSSGTSTGDGSFIWPVPSSHYITSGYGPRPGEFHKGIDIGASIGTPIVAVGDGTVIMAGPAEGFGHWVVIQHSNGVMSVYGHMFADELKVSAGEHVTAGQVIALVGEDGEATGPHLHFAIATGISGGRMDYVDPMGYLQ